jgi:tetratricopeptide (TPR) repeat protein
MRREVFTQSAQGLAAMLPLVPGLPEADWPGVADALPIPPDLMDARYANALTLQLAALTELLQHGPAPVPAVADTTAETVLLDHEKRYWAASAASPAFRLEDLPTATLDAAVAVAVLCGAADRTEAERALRAVAGLTAQQIPSVADWLAQLYPAAPGRLWASVKPDRIGEHHVASVLTAPVSTLDTTRLLADAAPAQQAQFVTVLAHAAVAAYYARRTQDNARIVTVVNTALETSDLEYRTALAVCYALPHRHRNVNPIVMRIARQLVAAETRLATLSPARHEPALACSLSRLGLRLAVAGRSDEALTAEQQAVEIRRRLAAADPEAYEPDLAGSLVHLGNRLSDVGRHQEARTETEEAVGIYRRLAADNPAVYEPHLAGSVSNLGFSLTRLHRRHEGLAAIDEGVGIFRRLAADDTAHESALSSALASLGNRLEEVGYYAEALIATGEALAIDRRLAAESPVAYEPDLARSLCNLGNLLAGLGRRDEAVTVVEEAVEINRRLAAADVSVHEPGLADSLGRLGIQLSGVGRHDEAQAAEQEAIEINRRRRLAAGDSGS